MSAPAPSSSTLLSPTISPPPTASPPSSSSIPAPPPASTPSLPTPSPPPASNPTPTPISQPPPSSSTPIPASSTTPPSATPPSPLTPPSPPAIEPISPPPPSPLAINTASPPPPAIKAPPPPPPRSPPKSSSTHAKSSSSASPSGSSNQISGAALVAIAAAGVIAVAVIVVLLICLTRNRKRKHYQTGPYYTPPPPPGNYKDQYYPAERRQQWNQPSPPSSDLHVQMPLPPPPPPFPLSDSFGTPAKQSPPYSESQNLGSSRSWFTYEELASATDNFAMSNLLGAGGFGCVYKGVLTGGQLVAVKQLKVGGGQGEKEFGAEVEIISRVHHRHLVSLVGYCIAGSQRLLVYDFVPNRTLEYHLHAKGIPVMDWSKRLKIAVGASRGLAYLHEDCHPRIIHRDIKSSNILLDNNFEAQVSDFGLAKLTSDANTHVTTRVMGTFGYLAPEYASSGKLTEKSDIFSFGVVLLELLTGRKPVDSSQPLGDESLVEWARPLLAQVLEDCKLELLVDPRLEGRYDEGEMMRMVEAAAVCVRHSAHKRPRMAQVVRLLEDDVALSDLNKGVRPGHSTIYASSHESTDYDSSHYSADMKRLRQTALGSREFGSEYSGATSDYGVNPSISSSEFQTSREVDHGARRPLATRQIGPRRTGSVSSSIEYSSSQET